MKNYYSRKEIRESIINFTYSGSLEPQRECAFFNKNIGQIQRHTPQKGENSIFVLDSQKAFSHAVRAGGIAFYASYWRYSDPFEANGKRGRDLVWSLKAEQGGIPAARRAAAIFIGFLENRGFPEPLVKYSGKLGFDILIPLEHVQSEYPSDSKSLSDIQKKLTENAVDQLEARDFSNLKRYNSKIRMKGETGTYESSPRLRTSFSSHPTFRDFQLLNNRRKSRERSQQKMVNRTGKIENSSCFPQRRPH